MSDHVDKDQVCVCGHPLRDHFQLSGACCKPALKCPCNRFEDARPTALTYNLRDLDHHLERFQRTIVPQVVLDAANYIEKQEAELTKLRRWKEEATSVLKDWDKIAEDIEWLENLGEKKSEIVAKELHVLMRKKYALVNFLNVEGVSVTIVHPDHGYAVYSGATLVAWLLERK